MYVVTHVLVFSLFPIGLALITFDRKSSHRIKVRFAELLFRIIGKRVVVSGLDNVEQGKGYLIVANYPSFYTGFILMKLFPEASIVVHAFISRVPVWSYFMKQLGAIFADPKGKGFRRTKLTIDRVIEKHKGNSIIILPEGQRCSDGHMQRFKRGFIYILRHSSLDLLPVTLSGFYRLKPVNRMYLDPDAEPEVIIHKPISNSAARDMSDEELLKMTVDVIERLYRP